MSRRKPFKNNVKKYRILKGIKQKDLAKEIGCSVSHLRHIENNKCCPRIILRLAIANFFEVSHYQMFYIENK